MNIKEDDRSGEARLEVNGKVAIITWSRGSKKNAFDSELAFSVGELFRSIQNRFDIAVIMLKGEGSVFCSGWDLSEIDASKGNPKKAVMLVNSGRACLQALDALDQLVISAVNGDVMGFGVSILGHSDIVIQAKNVKIRLPELRHGVVPSSVLGDLVPIVGVSAALRWSVLGEIPDSEAITTGLVTAIVDFEEFDQFIADLLKKLSMLDAEAVLATKRLSKLINGDSAQIARRLGDEASIEALLTTI